MTSYKISAQRLRNLTTGRLHTEITHVYEDLGAILGSSIMTHEIPLAMQTCEPWLRKHVTDARFWDGEFDQTHVGEVDLPLGGVEL